MIVDIKCEDETIQLGRIVHEHSDMYAVNFLNDEGGNIYNFSKETELISRESICGFYDVDNLEDTKLFVKVQNGYKMVDDSDDEDYVYSGSDSDSDDCSDISLVSENENVE